MPAVAAPSPRIRAMFRSLGVRNYRIYFWGGLVSNIGTWMQRTAQAWLVLQLSGAGAGAALGIVALLQFGPTLFLSVAAGTLSDRFAKHHILVITQGLAGLLSLLMGILDVAGILTLNQVYLIALLTGIVFAFDVPARQAFASELVGREATVNAVGLNTASFNVARLIGPPVAGLVIAGFTTWASFFVHALSAVAIVVSLLRMDVRALHRTAGSGSAAATRPGFLAGFGFLGSHPVVLALIAIAGLTAAIGANSLQVVIPLIATDVFGSDAIGFGLLTSALAVGGLVGALVASSTAGVPRLHGVFAVAAVLGVLQFAASFAPSMISFALALVGVGGSFMAFVVLVNTRVQLSAPAQVRGRVIAIYMMFFMGGGAFGAPVLGLIADRLGAMEAMTVSGVFGFVVACTIGGTVWLGKRIARRRRLAASAVVEPTASQVVGTASPLVDPATYERWSEHPATTDSHHRDLVTTAVPPWGDRAPGRDPLRDTDREASS